MHTVNSQAVATNMYHEYNETQENIDAKMQCYNNPQMVFVVHSFQELGSSNGYIHIRLSFTRPARQVKSEIVSHALALLQDTISSKILGTYDFASQDQHMHSLPFIMPHTLTSNPKLHATRLACIELKMQDFVYPVHQSIGIWHGDFNAMVAITKPTSACPPDLLTTHIQTLFYDINLKIHSSYEEEPHVPPSQGWPPKLYYFCKDVEDTEWKTGC